MTADSLKVLELITSKIKSWHWCLTIRWGYAILWSWRRTWERRFERRLPCLVRQCLRKRARCEIVVSAKPPARQKRCGGVEHVTS